MRVLIVEDDALVRDVLRQHVEALGHGVIEAATAEEAVQLTAAAGRLEVALCDMYLPGKHGLWLANELGTSNPEMAVILSTGAQDFEIAVTSLQNGVVDYLVKPYSRDQLAAALQRAFFIHMSRRAQAETEGELNERRAQLAAAVAELEQQASLLSMVTGLLSGGNRCGSQSPLPSLRAAGLTVPGPMREVVYG